MISAGLTLLLFVLSDPVEAAPAQHPLPEGVLIQELSRCLSRLVERPVTIEPVSDSSLHSFQGEKIEASQIARPARPSAQSVLRYCSASAAEAGARPKYQCFPFRASYPARVGRAKVRLPAGKEIGPSDIEAEETRLSPFESPPPEPDEMALGVRASRHIRAGTIIQRPDLAAPLSLRKGETVTVHLRLKALQIRFTSRATSDAKSGATTFIDSPFGGKRLRAVTAERGHAALDLNSLEREEE